MCHRQTPQDSRPSRRLGGQVGSPGTGAERRTHEVHHRTPKRNDFRQEGFIVIHSSKDAVLFCKSRKQRDGQNRARL